MLKSLGYKFLLLIFLCSSSSAVEWYRILEKSDRSIIIEVEVPALAVDTVIIGAQQSYIPRVADWPNIREEGQYALPFQSLLLHLPAGEAQVKVLHYEKGEGRKIALQPNMGDEPLGDRHEAFAQMPKSGSSASNFSLASLKYLGRDANGDLWSLYIYPFAYDSEKQWLSEIRKMRLQIMMESSAGSHTKTFSMTNTNSIFADIALAAAPQPILKKSTNISETNNFPCVKIYIEKDGLYRITGEDLKTAGVNLLTVNIKNLRLTCGGVDVPIYVHGWGDGQFHKNDYFEFWGEHLRQTFQHRSPDMYQDPFSSTNVYWLTWQGTRGQWMIDAPVAVSSSSDRQIQRPFSFYQTVHIERDEYFDHLYSIFPPDSLRDHWFFYQSIGAGQKASFSFSLEYPDERSSLPLQLRVMMAGLSAKNEKPHQISIFLNNRFVLRGQGSGQNIMDFRNTTDILLTGADLNHGENSLTIINEFDPNQSDYVLLNWFEVTYPRLYRAHNNMLKFTVPPDLPLGHYLFTVDGFTDSDIDVYRLGTSKLVGISKQEVTDLSNKNSIRISFEDYVQARETVYVAVAQSAKLKPPRMQLLKQFPSFSPNAGADYLLISTRKFLANPSVQKLISLRQTQGYRVGVVDVEDVFDVFGHGRRSSYALKGFLSWAYQHWPLRFVLFVGDGCYLRKPMQGDTLDIIPVHYRQTLNYGATATDHWYSLVDGEDEIPDIHIGRLPVRNEEQLQKVIDKIIEYETNLESGEWRNRLLFIGGEGQFFRDRGITLARQAPSDYFTALLFTTKDINTKVDPFYGGTKELLDHIDQGCAVVNFHGHGGGAIWSDNGLLRLEDTERMNNRNKYPIILSMTCYTAAFDNISERNLAKAMLFAENRGTMMFIGTSGFGWKENDVLLQTEFMDYLYENPHLTIGEILNAAKVRYYAKYKSDVALSEIIQYNLLGDPATRLRIPTKKAKVACSRQLLQKGDSLRISVQLPFSRGKSWCELADSTLFVVARQQQMLERNSIEFKVLIPRNFSSTTGSVSIYASDDIGLQQVHGSSFFSLTEVLFDSAWVEATTEDSFLFKAKILSNSPLSRIYCRVQDKQLDMVSTGANQYITQTRWHIADEVSYSFTAITSGGKVYTSPIYRYVRPGQMKLEIHANKWQWSGTDRVYLQAPVFNWGDGSGAALVSLEKQVAPREWQLVGYDTVTVAPFASTMAEVPFSIPPGRVRIRFGVRPLLMTDTNFFYTSTWVEATMFAIAPGGGFRIGNNIQDTLQVDPHFQLVSQRGSGQVPFVINITKVWPVTIHDQPDFHPIANLPAYQLAFNNEGGASQGLELTIDLSQAKDIVDSTLRATRIYRYHSASRKWVAIPTEAESPKRVKAMVSESGRYTALWAEDSQPPRIQIAVDGVQHSPNNYVGQNPQIMVRIQDINGVNLSPNKLQIFLDGQSTADMWALPDSIPNCNDVVIPLTPKLTAGLHQLQVMASDCNGNNAETVEVALRVVQDFKLQMLGNYPNPFKKETTFAYILTQPADRISLKIYTAAGKLIRKFDENSQADNNLLGADYHEITWDGTDEEGHKVANGVYFYRLTAKSGEKTREITGKIARIE